LPFVSTRPFILNGIPRRTSVLVVPIVTSAGVAFASIAPDGSAGGGVGGAADDEAAAVELLLVDPPFGDEDPPPPDVALARFAKSCPESWFSGHA